MGPYIFREDVGQTTKVILKNGLTVIVREQHAVPLVSITTHVKAGYFDEPDRVSGISHVIEHMFFKGTARRGVGEIAKETKALGGSLNAYTFYDRTVYHTVVPAEHVVEALDIQADALRNPTFDAAELAREIEVVLEENNRKLDHPPAVAIERLYGTAFTRHRMRRWRIGTPEGLRALTRDDVIEYYRTYYQPSNIILAIVGQFDREQMLADVVRLYGDAGDMAVARDASPPEPPQNTFSYNWERGPIELSQVSIGFHVPGALSEDAYAFEALAAILASGRASRMNTYLRDEQGLISSAASSFTGFRGLGYFELRLETSKPLEAQIAALTELNRVVRFGVTEEELARAKVLLAQEYYQRLETVGGVADELALQEGLGDWKRMDEYLPGVQAVSAEDIQRIAETHFTTANLAVFEYLPEETTRAFSEQDFRTSVLSRIPVDIVDRTIEELPVPAEIQLLDQELVTDIIRDPVRRSILRGPDVYVLEDHRLPLVSFGIFYPGGRLYESAGNAGITELMLQSALRGTRRYNTADISRRLENAGARIQVVNEPDFFGYVLDGMSGPIEDALDVLMEVLQEPTFLEAAVTREQQLQLDRIRQLREDNLRYPVQQFLATVFDSHPYSRPAAGSAESVSALTSDSLQEWHRLHQRTLVPLIVIVGDTSGTGLVAPIAETLTNEDLHERDISGLPPPRMDLEPEQAVETADRRQSALVWGGPAAQFADPDRFPLVVIENALSGLGGRLFETIREQQGLAYTVRVMDAFMARSGAFFAYTAFSPQNEEPVRASLEQEIRRVIEEGLTDEELAKAVNYSVGVHEISLQTRRGRTLAIARAVLTGNGIEDVTGYSDAIRRVTSEQVRAAAAKYLNPSTAKTFILRGTSDDQ